MGEYRWTRENCADGYEILLNPDGFEVTCITEPEDRISSRDLEPITVELNRLIAELRKLREENARLNVMLVAGNELTNKACALLSQLTGEPWPPKPPEVG